MRRTGLLLALALALFGLHAPPAAADSQGGLTLSVSPVRHELTAKKGQKLEAAMTVTNASSVALTLESSVKDFMADGEDGKPQFVPVESSPWSMSPWVKTKPAKVKLGPGEKQEVKILINVPKKAEPGGHYAAVLFSSVPDVKGQTALVASVGTLLLLDIDGPRVEQGAGELIAGRLHEPGPLDLSVRFENEGNVHVKPSGTIKVKPVVGGDVTEFEVGGENVLPSSARLFSATWEEPPTFGVFFTEASLSYGAGKQSAMTERRLLVVMPWKLVLAGLGLFGLGMLFARVRRRKAVRQALAAAAAKDAGGAAATQG
jgi:hypothetical protein